jgi:D-alanine-D-alanine ligase
MSRTSFARQVCDARNPRLTESTFDCVAIMGNSFGYFSNKKDDEKVLATVGKILRRELRDKK